MVDIYKSAKTGLFDQSEKNNFGELDEKLN